MVLEETALSILSPNYIATVGFPIAAFTIIIMILIFLIRDCTKRNIECQNSKDGHIVAFFKQNAESQDKHTEAIHDITEELKNITGELKGISAKVDVYSKIIERQMDMSDNE
jgi:hypothetical protein